MYHRGYHGDLNETFFVGTPKPVAKKLVQNTWECLEKVICIKVEWGFNWSKSVNDKIRLFLTSKKGHDYHKTRVAAVVE